MDPSALRRRKAGGDLVLSLFQEEKEKRRLEQLERKKELQRLLEEEDSKLKGKSPKQVTPGKVTRAQIEETIRKDQQQKENADTGLVAPQKGPGEREVGLFLFHLLSLKDEVSGKLELPAAILCCVLCHVCV